jgi:hypothetical protein
MAKLDPKSAVEELESMANVREVKEPTELGHIHLAVEGKQTYQDTRMKNPSTRVVAPQNVITWAADNGWIIGHLGFYTNGDYAGCFSLRLEPSGGA